MSCTLARSLVWLALLVGFPYSVRGQAISLNFSGGGGISPDPATATLVGPAQFAGVVPVANWNNAGGRSGTLVGLVDSAGAITAATATWNSNGTYAVTAINAATSGNHALMKAHLDARAAGFGSPTDATLSITGIPVAFSNYDVYIYFDADTNNGSVDSNYNIGAQTYYMRDTTTFAGTFTQATGTTTATRTAGANFAKFSNLSGNSFTLTADSEAFRAQVSGVQIVARAAVGASVSLADIVGGGNGPGNGRIGYGFDQITGNVVTDSFDRGAVVNGTGFNATPSSNFVNGVFVVDGGVAGLQQYATTGATMSALDTNNQTWDTIENRANNSSGSVLSGIDYNNVGGNTMIGLHSNNGITFDLDAIEAAYGKQVVGFSTIVGLAHGDANAAASYSILLDGVLMASDTLDTPGERLVGLPVSFAIGSTARFLTLVSTDANNNIGFDQIIFGNPTLTLLVVPEPTSLVLFLVVLSAAAVGLRRRRVA